MSMTINGNTAAVNWESLLGKVGDLTKTAGVDGAAGTTNVKITTTVDGVATPVTINIPDDLELPGTVDQAAIDSLCQKLAADTGLNLSDEQINQFHDSLTNTLKEVAGQSSAASAPASTHALKSAMFDIYKMMALLVEVAQKQRDAQREMRLAENQSVQKSILNQAEAQRDAAITGMIAGAVCCALQVGATSFALYQQGKAFKAQLGTDKTAGLDVASQSVEMYQAANNHESAQTQLNKVADEVGGKPSLDNPDQTVKQKVDASFRNEEFRKDATKFTTEKAEFERKVQLSQELQTFVDPERIDNVTSADIANLQGTEVADIKTAVRNLDHYKAEVAKVENARLSNEDKAFFLEKASKPFESLSFADRTKLMQLRMTNKYGLELVDLGDKPLVQLKAEVKTAFNRALSDVNSQIVEGGSSRKAVITAKDELRAQIKLEIGKFETAYEAELKNYNDALKNGTPEEIAAADTRLTSAANELKYARALGNEKLMANDLTDSRAHLADVEDARSKYISAQHTRANSVDYIKASNTINTAQAVNGLISAIGSFTQGFIQNLTQLQQSEATKMGAEQKKAEEELDQTRDLFNQAEELVNSIVKLMQAVVGAETQSMRDAIQA